MKLLISVFLFSMMLDLSTSKCPVGHYTKVNVIDFRGQTFEDFSCISCPIGTYSLSGNVTECTPCPGGTTTTWDGAISEELCTKCEVGFFQSKGECVDCPLGSYFSLNRNRTGYTCKNCHDLNQDGSCNMEWCEYSGSYTEPADNYNPCRRCPLGTYSESGRVLACKRCPAGTSTPFKGMRSINSCTSCEIGYLEVDAKCEPCPQGTIFQFYGNYSCIPCNHNDMKNPLNTAGVATLDPADCVCDQGTEKVDYYSRQCTRCEVGYYKDAISNDYCLKCPDFHSTLTNGTKDKSECTCDMGAEMNTEINRCVLCAVGEYSDEVGSRCKKCPENKTTEAAGSSDASQCLCKPGYFYDTFGDTCLTCPSGTFSDMVNSTICSKCPEGTTSASGVFKCDSI